METLTLDDLMNVRDVLNDRILTLVEQYDKGNAQQGTAQRAHALAQTRDKVQEIIDKRQAETPSA